MAAETGEEFADIEAKAIGAGWATKDQTALIWHDWSKSSAGDGNEFEAMEEAIQSATPAKSFVESNQ
jgi:hypothetical protein